MTIPEPLPEDGLLARVAAREPEAARQLLDETGPVVYGFIFARVGGDNASAEDLLQTTYLEAVGSARSFRGEAAITTWLCTIARRQIARHFKAERRHALLTSQLRLIHDESESDMSWSESLALSHDVIIRALGRLPVTHRQVLVLKYLDGLSTADIAGELGRKTVQIQSLLQRARAGLRRELEAADRD